MLTSDYGPASYSASRSVEFAPTFPRIAALRGRIRGRLGMSAPTVRGGFYQFAQPMEMPTAAQIQSPTPALPMPVGDGPTKVVVGAESDDLAAAMQTEVGTRFRAKLRDYRLLDRFQILAAAKALRADGGQWVDVLKTLLDLMITYGPKLIELLKLFGIL